jgi:hypothetical protein
MKNHPTCHELVGIQPSCEILLKVEKIINGFKYKSYGVCKNFNVRCMKACESHIHGWEGWSPWQN